jgi:urease accessory protein
MAIIIETKPTAQMEPTPAGRIEVILLDWEDRRKPRQRAVTDQGTEVVLALPRGTVLAEGDCLYQNNGLTIKVQAKVQSVIKVMPANQVETCRVAHHLGNWHRSIEVLADGTLKAQSDEPFEEWLKREGFKYERIEAPFHPNCKGAEH